MNRMVAFTIFFTVFLTIYLGMYFYVFTRSATMLGVTKNFYLYLSMVVVAFLFILANFLQRIIPGQISKILYSTTAIISTAIFLAFFLILLHDLLNIFVKTPAFISGVVIIGLVVVLSLYGTINALFIDVKEVEIPISNLEKDLRIVQISDLHLGPIHSTEYLAKIVDKINLLEPDLVVITGDLADGMDHFNENTVKPLNDLKAKTFFVTGNHDEMFGTENLMKILATTSVKTLRNEAEVYKGVQLIGVDNPGELGSSAKLSDILQTIKLDKNKTKILLYHQPTSLEEANKFGIDLQLSGHLHNGQVAPFGLITRLFFHKLYGLYDFNGTKLYVSAGTGTWGPPMRLGSRNEITLLKLISE